MPLKIEMSPESVRPLVICDQCGEAISDARDGHYEWQRQGYIAREPGRPRSIRL